ncbi:hypothetical protein NDU88_008612 [Pleurodeles waltl]|uniref:Uncharacterized protein n=1 Tax=Pleurodeles waltl TaxID=8319 RepID=A0AAV7QSZ3_PLEWA|nr:hypothetical protein NDU88_008612 [Pleurodeles waltl]
MKVVKPKGHTQTQSNKMDKYAVTWPAVVNNGGGEDTSEVVEPLLGTIMVAIQDLKNSLEPKLDAVTVDVKLLRADFCKMSEKVTSAELHINLLQSTSKKLEDQFQYLTKQQALMAARLEDLEGRRRNNIQVVGVPEGAEGPSMDLFLEDLIVNTLCPKCLSKFFSIEQAHRSLMPLPKPGAMSRTIIPRVFNHRDVILLAARTQGDLTYENATIQFFPDFTLQVQLQRFDEVKKLGQVQGH